MFEKVLKGSFQIDKVSITNVYEINFLVSSDPGIVVPFSAFCNNNKCIDNFCLF